jgi:hypothetical protein
LVPLLAVVGYFVVLYNLLFVVTLGVVWQSQTNFVLILLLQLFRGYFELSLLNKKTLI